MYHFQGREIRIEGIIFVPPSSELLWNSIPTAYTYQLWKMVVLSPLEVLSHLPFYSLSHCLNILRWFYPVAWALGYWTRSHPVTYLLAAKLAHILRRPHSPPGKPNAWLGRLTDSKVSLYWSVGRITCLQGQINIYKYILYRWKGCIAVNRDMSSDLKVVCLCLG